MHTDEIGTYLEGDAWPSPLLKTVDDLSTGISPDGEEEVEGCATIARQGDWEGDREGAFVGSNRGAPQHTGVEDLGCCSRVVHLHKHKL